MFNPACLLSGIIWNSQGILFTRKKLGILGEFLENSGKLNIFGGLAIFVRDGLNFNVKKNTMDNGYHHVAVELLASSGRVLVHGIYRPPGYDVNSFFNHVENIVSSGDSQLPCFLLGDMNIAVNDLESQGTQRYLQLLTSYNMIVTNTHITRPASNNLLDHVITQSDISDRIKNYTIDCSLSDHRYVLTQFTTKMSKTSKTLTKTLVNHRLVNSDFQTFLQSSEFSSFDPNDRISLITDKYSQLVNKFSTTISVEVKVKPNTCPWYNFDIWKLSKISNNLFQRWKRDRLNTRLKSLLEHANHKLTNAKRLAKSAYYRKIFASNNPKHLWSKINELIGNTSGKDKSPVLEADGIESTNPADVGQIFNAFFSSVGENIASNLVSDGNINKFNTMATSNRSMFIRPTSQMEVYNIISGLDVSKATGIDGFSVMALKQNSVALSAILCDCFNDSVSLGTYPKCLKTALVFPVFKGGNPKDPTNYRPISVLSSINKVFEKILSLRLNSFMDVTGLLYHRQFGFRQGSSTEVAVLELVDDIACSIDRKMCAATVFLDLSKAFDTINHRILLQKLDAYGVRGSANDLLRSYLTDRNQQVVVSGIRSPPCSITCGVPQGSNLGPLLFLIYVNDIARLNLKGKLRLFADDTAISYEASYANELNQCMSTDLQKVMEYLENNLLALNLQKTKMMLFGVNDAQRRPVLRIRGVIIEEVDRFKYLGVLIDNLLKWDLHIREIVAKCASLCGILRKLSSFVPRHVLLKMYYAFIHCRYQYGISVWGSSYNTYLKEIQVQQNRCVKSIYRLPFLQPTNTLYSAMDHNILPVVGLYTMKVGVTMFKIINNENLHHNWSFNAASHEHQTRQAHLLQRSGFRTEIGRRRFVNMGPSVFNQIPDSVKNSASISLFKKGMANHIKNNINNFIIH